MFDLRTMYGFIVLGNILFVKGIKLHSLAAPTDHLAIVVGHDAVKEARVVVEDHWQEEAITRPEWKRLDFGERDPFE